MRHINIGQEETLSEVELGARVNNTICRNIVELVVHKHRKYYLRRLQSTNPPLVVGSSPTIKGLSIEFLKQAATWAATALATALCADNFALTYPR